MRDLVSKDKFETDGGSLTKVSFWPLCAQVGSAGHIHYRGTHICNGEGAVNFKSANYCPVNVSQQEKWMELEIIVFLGCV